MVKTKYKVKIYRIAAMLELEVEGDTPEARRDDAVRQAKDAIFLRPNIKYLVLDDTLSKNWSGIDLCAVAKKAQENVHVDKSR